MALHLAHKLPAFLRLARQVFLSQNPLEARTSPKIESLVERHRWQLGDSNERASGGEPIILGGSPPTPSDDGPTTLSDALDLRSGTRDAPHTFPRARVETYACELVSTWRGALFPFEFRASLPNANARPLVDGFVGAQGRRWAAVGR